jgi:hypothetical protein
MLAEVVESLSEMDLSNTVVSQSVPAQYLSVPNLVFGLYQAGQTQPLFIESPYDASDGAMQNLIEKSDVIIAFDPSASVIDWLPAARSRDRFIALIQASAVFELLKTVTDPSGAGPLYIYRRQVPRR